MKIQANKKEIMGLATNGKVYQQALALVGQERVKAIHFNESERILRAWILDLSGQKQKVSILLKQNGYLQKNACSCKDSKRYYGLCEHQVALLLKVLGNDLKDYATLKSSKLELQEIEDSLKRSTHQELKAGKVPDTGTQRIYQLMQEGKTEAEALSIWQNEQKKLKLASNDTSAEETKEINKSTTKEDAFTLQKSSFSLDKNWKKDKPFMDNFLQDQDELSINSLNSDENSYLTPINKVQDINEIYRQALEHTVFTKKDIFLSTFYARHWLTPNPHKSSYLASANTEWAIKEDFALDLTVYLYKANITPEDNVISDVTHASSLNFGLKMNFIYQGKNYPVNNWLALRLALKKGEIYEVHKQFHFHPFHHKTTRSCASILTWLSLLPISQQGNDPSILLLQETQIASLIKLLSQNPDINRQFILEGKQKILPFEIKNTWPHIKFKAKKISHPSLPNFYIVYLLCPQKLYGIYEGGHFYWQGETLYEVPYSSSSLLQSIKFLLREPYCATVLDETSFYIFASLFLQDVPHLLLENLPLNEVEEKKVLLKESKIKELFIQNLLKNDFIKQEILTNLMWFDIDLLKQNLVRENLACHIYLDLNNKGLSLKLCYEYGDGLCIYPHPRLIHANLQQNGITLVLSFARTAGLEDERLIYKEKEHPIFIREFAKELAFLHLLRQANFLPLPAVKLEDYKKLNEKNAVLNYSLGAQFTLLQAKEIYHFVKNILPIFEKYAVVSKSPTFQRLKLKPLKLAPFHITYDQQKANLSLYLTFPDTKEFLTYDNLLQALKQSDTDISFLSIKNKGLFDLSHPLSQNSLKIFNFLQEESNYIHKTILVFNKLDSDTKEIYQDFVGQPPKDLPCVCFKIPVFRFLDLFNLLDTYKRDFTYTLSPQAKEYKLLFDNPQKFLNLNKKKLAIDSKWKKILRPYQQTGFKWLRLLSLFNLGGILADDMGLGKTLQTLVFIEALLKENTNPILVVVPTALSYNWQAEAQKFLPDIDVVLIEGLANERHRLLASWGKRKAILIASYGVVRKDISYFEKYHLTAVFLDEAQVIKNPQSMLSRYIKKLNSKYRFALSGTPIENHLSELWSIFDFLMPNYLYTQKFFHKNYVLPLQADNKHSCMSDLKKKISPFILRRYKKDVLKDLPPKLEAVISCGMSIAQAQLYHKHLLNTFKFIKQKEDLEPSEIGQYQIQILAQLTRLRQICCHPSLVTEDEKMGSGKLDTLIYLLEEAINSKHRCLVFSSFTGALNIIAKTLSKNPLLNKFFYLDGQTKAVDRQAMVQRFNEGENDIFLISLKAGGTGLNLTGADTVILFDPWWNPAVENQAMDRAHRFGQDKTVQVYRLITKNSIENHILELQKKKQDLFKDVIEDGARSIEHLSIEQLNGLVYDAMHSFNLSSFYDYETEVGSKDNYNEQEAGYFEDT